jgi:hypothetical protein
MPAFVSTLYKEEHQSRLAMSTCCILLTYPFASDKEREQLVRDYRERIGPAMRTARGFRHLRLLHGLTGPRTFLPSSSGVATTFSNTLLSDTSRDDCIDEQPGVFCSRL